MKKNLLILIIALSPFFGNAQCNNELIKLCVKENGGATYLKEFPVKLKKGRKGKPQPMARYAIVLSKGSRYRFNVKNDSLNTSFAILQLSDDRKIYGSTYDQYENINYSAFDFFCRNTGTYYIAIIFKEKKEGCAVGLLSLVDVFKIY